LLSYEHLAAIPDPWFYLLWFQLSQSTLIW
jgi:hypothetical protein